MTPAGTPAVCDDVGGVTSAPDDTDTPADDGNPCTDDVCASGAPSHPAKADGSACSGANGAKLCLAAACVQCIARGDCAGTDTICRKFVCQSDHTCGHTDTAAGAAAEPDATGNCHKALCDGAGGVASVVDDTDKPVDGNACTADVCTNGTPSNPNLSAGTSCSTNASPPDGSKVCDGSATCTPITFRVVRIGTGTGALSSAAAAVFVEERRTDGSTVGTIALPTTANGAQLQLTMSGSASSEGGLALSGDGHYLTLAG